MRAFAVVLAVLLGVLGWSQPRLRLETGIGHTLPPTSAAFSPDGRLVLTASWDQTARLWEAATGREVRRFEGHEGVVTSAAFFPDGKLVFTASSDLTARIWDASTGKEVRRFDGGSGVEGVAFSPDGKRILTADGTGRLWDASTGKDVRRFGGGSGVEGVAFSPDGKRILTASLDGTARLWDATTGNEVRRFEGHGGLVSSGAFSRDGKLVLTTSSDGTARLWDAATGKEIRRFEGSGSWLSGAAFSPDGKLVLTVGHDKTARLWDVATGKEIRRFDGHEFGISSAAFAPDGKLVLTASLDGTARLWSVATGQEVRRFEGHGRGVASTAFSSQGKHILTASLDGTARLWDTTAGKEVRRFEDHESKFNSAAVSADGMLVLTAGHDKTARLWDAATGREVRRFEGHGHGVESVAFSLDGKLVLTASGNIAYLWDAATGKEIRRFEGHEDWVTCVAFFPDGKLVLTASDDGTARLWDAATGKEVRRFEGHGDWVASAVASPNGKLVLTANEDGTARLLDASTGKEVRRFEGHGHGVESAAFSPDGKLVLTASRDRSARLWDAATGKEVRRFEGHGNWVESAAFSPDGKLVLTASDDGTARIWDTATGKELCALISYRDGSWAVVDPKGRYDSSENGHNPNLYWVFEDPAKGILEPIDVDQFSYQFYTQGLLARVMSREELPPVPDLQNPQLFPKVSGVQVRANQASFTLTARGGGIGTARVLVDGQEVAQVQGKEGKNAVTLPVPVAPGAKVDVVAFNENDSLASPRGSGPTPPPLDLSTPTRYFAVIAGVNDYSGSLPDLGFAVADAVAISKSIQTLAKGLTIQPEIYVLTNDPTVKSQVGADVTVLPATHSSFEDVLTKIIPSKGAWKPSDMLFLFLAGHGTSYTQRNQKHYAYLTQDATSADMGKDDVRRQQAVTDDDLVSWLVHYLGGKKAVVIDTCAAGTAVEAFKEGVRSSDPDLDRRQAVYETQRRTGVKMLFGCADELVSYEAPQYGHGLLTWALLNSLANDPLGNDQVKDMVLAGTLFNRVEQAVGSEKGGQQRAQQFGARENFPLGFLDDSGRKAIPFTSKVPLFGTITLLNLDPNVASDDLKLVPQIVSFLTTNARGGRPAAVLYPSSALAIKVTGGYLVNGDEVSFTLTMELPGKEPARLKFQANRANAAEVAAGKLLEWAKAQKQ